MKQFNQMMISNFKKIVTIIKSKILRLCPFCIYKMYLTSAGGYINAGVQFLKIRKTDETRSSMKDCGNGLGCLKHI